MPVHKSHLSGKTKTILRCYLVISATWKRNMLIYFPCVMFHVKHLKKVPTGVEKALSKRPMHTSQQEEYDVQVFSSKTQTEAKVLVLRDTQLLSFWDSSNEDTAEPFWSLLLRKKTKEKDITSPNLIFLKKSQQRIECTIPTSILKVYCSFREAFPNTNVLK